jgi:hypothetical protein
MKNYSNKLLITTLFLTMCTSVVCGQWGPGATSRDNTTFTLLRKITLNGESSKLEIILPVADRIWNFTIKISSEIKEGELTIEIYDPSGEKQGNYSIDSQSSLKPNKTEKTANPNVKEIVTGQISKSIDFPKNGNWKIAIIPKNAKGNLEIASNQLTDKSIKR